MSSWGFASRVTRLTVSSDGGTSQLLEGEPLRLWGFVVTNAGTSTNSTLTITSGDGNTTYYSLTLGASHYSVVDTKFIADKGIRISVSGANFADIGVTFFHSQVGS